MEASNTCGDNGNQEYCIQTGYSNKKSCDNICNAGDHGGEFLTDIHDPSAQTWWQSETMFEGVQSPNQVNLTLHLGMKQTRLHTKFAFIICWHVWLLHIFLPLLFNWAAGKSFDITYIRIVFFSPRPESFAIYKRQTINGPWIPYQYYRYVLCFISFIFFVHASLPHPTPSVIYLEPKLIAISSFVRSLTNSWFEWNATFRFLKRNIHA